jgi:hypothetical protein
MGPTKHKILLRLVPLGDSIASARLAHAAGAERQALRSEAADATKPPAASGGAFHRCDLVYFARSLTRKKYRAVSTELSVATQPLLSHEKPFEPAA